MGVAIGELLSSVAETIDIASLLDKRIAIDAYNWIYQFLSIIRQKDGEPLKDSKGRVTSHLSGLFYRTMKLLEAGIKPIYVFDGEPPLLKVAENEKRRDIRLEAKREWQRALEREAYEEARKYAQRASTITDEIIDDSKSLLDAMGIPIIQAPSEGEAQCALMVKNSDAWGVATQDYDSLLFGCPNLIRNLNITGKRRSGDEYVIINPELIRLKSVLSMLNINQDQLIMLGILVGTDYNPGGVKGVGPKKALELVKKNRPNKIINEIDFGDIEPEKIINLFKNPKVDKNYKIGFKELNKEKVKGILCDEHDFSEERVDNALQKLEEKGEQRSLSKWLEK